MAQDELSVRRQINDELAKLEAYMTEQVNAAFEQNNQGVTVDSFTVYDVDGDDLIGRVKASDESYWQFRITPEKTILGKEDPEPTT